VNSFRITTVIDGVKQPLGDVRNVFPRRFPAQIKKFSDFSQPAATGANWITSSCAGVTRAGGKGIFSHPLRSTQRARLDARSTSLQLLLCGIANCLTAACAGEAFKIVCRRDLVSF
jgi:hypothetical protein